ncbi:uncharacterized protein LOC125211447 [Salvia hispanica]|uniref:uncharacterized protein LOC125211447 n=1 Tax=Salvia hispanica TaxID=49212 RepID=UPI002009757A|nr:uncharacterized protein LOC125211447 [Salvia hispanica]
MEIPEINMLCDFEAGIKCLQNPSTISRFFSFPGFWKYGALIFAIFATFSSLIRRIKLIFIRFHTVKPCFIQTEDEFDFSDDEDDAVSVASSDDEQEAEEDRDRRRDGEDFCVRGSILSFRSGQLRQRNRRSSCGGGAWSEIASGKNVVKLWDSLGFNLDLDEDLFNYDSSSVVSTWNRDREERSGDFSGEIWPAPAVVLTAEGNAKGDGVILGGYDRRMRSGVPALVAEWKLSGGGGLASGGGVSKVYVRDDVSGVVTVGDVRNVRRPLECVRESDGETWWDADAVIVENE